ncbi:MAG TPA: aminotransferase class I/II-fold pyridoxal phosphate-dependent enzyme, partial [Elusimicrobiota bacterium]|nr:aminotransferase class I/II-fold pyridoxal phosphate-dependent enzyme [Elusimicrobiota bacterium]
PPFNISYAAQVAAAAALADKNQVRRSLRLVKTEMARLEAAFRKMDVAYVPSAGNFLLIDVSPHKGADVFAALLKKGVIVRAVAEYGLPHYLRVTVGRPEENTLFLKAFQEVRQSP